MASSANNFLPEKQLASPMELMKPKKEEMLLLKKELEIFQSIHGIINWQDLGAIL